jgi:hypothetical protein
MAASRKQYNLARVNCATAGTGALTLGAAVPGYLTFAQAGAVVGDVLTYAIWDKGTAGSEIGQGTYSATNTLTRDTIFSSTNGNAALALSGNAEVIITIAAQDLLPDAPNDANTYGRHAAAWTQVLPISGGTLTGSLILSADPTAALGAVTKQYVDARPGFPTFQWIPNAASGTWTRPAGCRWIRFRMVGGGGGGGGSGAANGETVGGTGGDTTFAGCIAHGGAGGRIDGGTALGAATYDFSGAISGTIGFGVYGGLGAGSATGQNYPGGAGGVSFFGGGAGASAQAAIGQTGISWGSGGGGGGSGNATAPIGGGGNAGAYIEGICNAPPASLNYVVGAGGTPGNPGAGYYQGNQGQVGCLIIESYNN